MQRAAAAQDRSIQQHNNKPQQPAKLTMQEREKGEREEEEKGRKEREKGRKGEREKEEKEREAEKERDKEVKEDMTGWTVLTRNKKQKERTVHIFVKMNESKRFPLDVSPDDKVNDVIEQIQNDEC